MPIISAIPTGSFAPDSPSRIVPVRPPISRSPSTENMTAGIGRRDRRPEQAGGRPAEAERPVRDERRSPPAVANVPTMPSDAIGTAAPRSAASRS